MTKLLIMTLLFSSTFAVATIPEAESTKTKIKEIKEWVETVPQETTCADEYLLRRKQLSIRLGLTPVILAGGTVAGMFAGGFVGIQIYYLSATQAGGFADLAALLGGGMIGGLAGLGTTGTAETITLINFFRNQNILRLIYESQNIGGIALDSFYQNFQEEYPDSQISKFQFQGLILALDQQGRLCDGSIVNPKRFKKGKKLKQRLADRLDIFEFVQKN